MGERHCNKLLDDVQDNICISSCTSGDTRTLYTIPDLVFSDEENLVPNLEAENALDNTSLKSVNFNIT